MKFIYKQSSRLYDLSVLEEARKLLPYIRQLQKVEKEKNYEADEASILLPDDAPSIAEIKKLAEGLKTSSLKYIVIIGIGGSNLGTKAIYDAFFGHYENLEDSRFPKMIFLDTVDSALLDGVLNILGKLESPEEVVLVAASKSGGTTETMANLEVVFEQMKRQFGESINKRSVFITDPGSKLDERAKEMDIPSMNIPPKVGGRFSVFSAVGLMPLFLLPISVEELLSGAEEMRNLCLNEDVENNPAALSASVLHLHNQKGVNIHNSFLFLPQLESVGKWYRQLLAESLGKEKKGLTPIVSIGSIDHHSTLQLYFGGPEDKLHTLVSAEKQNKPVTIPTSQNIGLLPALQGKSLDEIMQAIYEGTRAAMLNEQVPFVEVLLERLDERGIGAFLQMKMFEVMFLGRLLGINAFDQPQVELYKIETKKFLEK